MVDKVASCALERLKELEQEMSLSAEAVFDHPSLAITVFNIIPDAIILSDMTSVIRLANKAAEELFGYDWKELVGNPVCTLMPERFRDAHESHQVAYFESPHERTFRNEDIRGLRKDGEEFPIDIALKPIVSNAGTLVMAVIRERKEKDNGA